MHGRIFRRISFWTTVLEGGRGMDPLSRPRIPPAEIRHIDPVVACERLGELQPQLAYQPRGRSPTLGPIRGMGVAIHPLFIDLI